MEIVELHLIAAMLVGVAIGWMAARRWQARKAAELIKSALQVIANQAAELGRR
jgi:hypothetical protein